MGRLNQKAFIRADDEWYHIPTDAKATGVTWAIMKLEIQAADDVMAVAFARVALLNISTGTAHVKGPIAAENTRLN